MEDWTLAQLKEVALTLSTRIHEQAEKTSGKASAFLITHHQGLPDDRLPPLLETKLYPPRLPAGLVERTRLLARLDTCLANTLTLVMAPAGFGKSTLVNQWLAARLGLLPPPPAPSISL